MSRSPVSVAHLCFFELDWCSGGWDQDDGLKQEEGCDQSSDQLVMQQAAENNEAVPAAKELVTNGADLPPIKRKHSLEDFAERFRKTQQALLGGTDTPEEQKTATVESAVQASRRKSESMRNAMILTMLSSGDNAQAQAAADAARSGHPLIVSPYQVLQVRRDATTSEIQHAYRRLALWHHPGRCCGGAISPEERCRRQHVFEILAASYETLLDREARARCDMLLREKYEKRTRSKNIPQGQVCVGGKPLSENSPKRGKPSQDNSAIENFAASLISQLAFIRGLGNGIELAEVNDNSNNMLLGKSGGHHPTTPPSIEPVSSSDDSSVAADNGQDDNSDCSSECSVPHSNVTAGRIHVPLGTVLGSQQQQPLRGRYVESTASSPLSFSVDFSGTRSSTSSPAQRISDSPEQPRSPRFLSMNPCGMSSFGSFESQMALPALINSTSTSAEVKGEIHYTEGETNRLFGGPLQLLYRARRWKPFSDPYVVFADVFGSNIPLGTADPTSNKSVPVPSDGLCKTNGVGGDGGSTPLLTQPHNTNSAAWTGSAETLPDGTQIFKTSRILNNRRMTRTEAVRTDPITGLKYSKVTVTSELIENEEDGDSVIGKSTKNRDGSLSLTDKTIRFWNDLGFVCCNTGDGSAGFLCCSSSLDSPPSIMCTEWCGTMTHCTNNNNPDYFFCGSGQLWWVE
ncbi:hypothetical protein ACA910_003811 [Epithemia clementina (nom. ined.)]